MYRKEYSSAISTWLAVAAGTDCGKGGAFEKPGMVSGQPTKRSAPSARRFEGEKLFDGESSSSEFSSI
jgi:hypothetical protein